MNESIVTKTTITLPVNGGALEAISTIETVPYWTRSRKSGNILFKKNKTNNNIYFISLITKYLYSHVFFTAAQTWADTTTTDQSETASEAPSIPVSYPLQLRTPGGGKKHHFIPKTVRLENWIIFFVHTSCTLSFLAPPTQIFFETVQIFSVVQLFRSCTDWCFLY